MPESQFEAAYNYMSGRLRAELPGNLYYHGPRHTLDDVLPAAKRLAQLAGLVEEDSLLLQTAALYHDIGYCQQYAHNEPIAARIAVETLAGFGYSASQIEAIQTIILATQVPQQPHSLLEELMCDADLDGLGRDDFYMISFSLRQELIEHGKDIPLRDWFIQQLTFLQTHRYFSPAARQLRDEGKQQHIHEIKSLLEST